jgi:hypothetical protein
LLEGERPGFAGGGVVAVSGQERGTLQALCQALQTGQ